MKRFLLIMIIIFTSSFIYSAYKSEMTKDFTLQAGYDTVMSVGITEIASQTNQYVSGMPFNIEEYQVRADATEHGREIATWNLLSNTSNFNLVISGEPMYWEGDTKKESPLNYNLNIQYVLGYYLPDGSISNNTTRWLTYCNEDGEVIIDLLEGLQIADNSFIGNIDGGIFFEFTPKSSDDIARDMGKSEAESTYKPGNYTATVTFALETKE